MLTYTPQTCSQCEWAGGCRLKLCDQWNSFSACLKTHSSLQAFSEQKQVLLEYQHLFIHQGRNWNQSSALPEDRWRCVDQCVQQLLKATLFNCLLCWKISIIHEVQLSEESAERQRSESGSLPMSLFWAEGNTTEPDAEETRRLVLSGSVWFCLLHQRVFIFINYLSALLPPAACAPSCCLCSPLRFNHVSGQDLY